MLDWIDRGKLKSEWKTAALAVVGIILEIYDAVVVTGMVDLPRLFNESIRPFVAPAVLVSMLLLRKWKDAQEP